MEEIKGRVSRRNYLITLLDWTVMRRENREDMKRGLERCILDKDVFDATNVYLAYAIAKDIIRIDKIKKELLDINETVTLI